MRLFCQPGDLYLFRFHWVARMHEKKARFTGAQSKEGTDVLGIAAGVSTSLLVEAAMVRLKPQNPPPPPSTNSRFRRCFAELSPLRGYNEVPSAGATISL